MLPIVPQLSYEQSRVSMILCVTNWWNWFTLLELTLSWPRYSPPFTRKCINVFTSAAWLHSTPSYTYFLETTFQYYLPILRVCGLRCLLASVLSLEFCMRFSSTTNHGFCDITNNSVGFCWKLRSVSCEHFIAVLTPKVIYLLYLMPATAWLIQMCYIYIWGKGSSRLAATWRPSLLSNKGRDLTWVGWISRLTGWQYCVVVWRFRFQISARRPAFLSEIFRCLTQNF